MSVTAAHKPFEFQIGNVPRFGLLDRQECKGAFECVIKTQEFFFDDLDVSGRLPINID